MRVNNFKLVSNGIELDFSCSKCGRPVEPTFVHCPMCGAKLSKVSRTLSREKVCDIIDDYLHTTKEPSITICLRGKTSDKDCEFLSDDGICQGVVYPTYPPQMDKCTFHK